MRIETVQAVGPRLGIAPTCAALGLPTATYYRRTKPPAVPTPRPSPPRALAAPSGGLWAASDSGRYDHVPRLSLLQPRCDTDVQCLDFGGCMRCMGGICLPAGACR